MFLFLFFFLHLLIHFSGYPLQLLHTNTNIIFTLTGDKQLQSSLIVLSTQFLIDSGTSNLKHPISLLSTEYRDKGGGVGGDVVHIYMFTRPVLILTSTSMTSTAEEFLYFSIASPLLAAAAMTVLLLTTYFYINGNKPQQMMRQKLESVDCHIPSEKITWYRNKGFGFSSWTFLSFNVG